MMKTILVIVGMVFCFYAGGYFTALVYKEKLNQFFETYWSRISPDTDYCRGARDMFTGLISEFGLRIVIKENEEDDGLDE
jgi:hypothetical protein